LRPEQQPQTVGVSPYEGKRNNFHYNVMVVRIGESNPVSHFCKVNARLAHGFGICRASPLGYRHGRHRETRTHPPLFKEGGVCVVTLSHELYELYINPQPPSAETVNHKYIELLSAMATALGFRKLKQTDIDKFYYPTAHGKQLEAQVEAQAEWLRVLKKTDHFLAEPRAPEVASASDIPMHPNFRGHPLNRLEGVEREQPRARLQSRLFAARNPWP